MEFFPYPDVPADAVDTATRIVRAARLDVGGIEYLETDDGRRVFYDINANSNLRPSVAAAFGFDPFERVVDFLVKATAGLTRTPRRPLHGVAIRALDVTAPSVAKPEQALQFGVGSGTGDRHHVARGHCAAALGANAHTSNRFASAPIAEHNARPARVRHPPLPPLGQDHQQDVKVSTLARQPVLHPPKVSRAALPRQDARPCQAAQTVGEHVGRDPELALKLVEPPQSVERVTED